MNFQFAHDYDIDVPTYWKIFLSEPFNVEMYRDLKMKKREVVKQEDDGKVFVRWTHIEPTTPIPGWLQAVVKGSDYTEKNRLVWADNAMEVVIETSMFKDRFQMRGMYTVSPLDGGARCRREFKGDVKVSIPLLGGRIEKYMMEQLRDSYEIAARTTRKWIAGYKAQK